MTRQSIPALLTKVHNSEVNPVVKKKKKKCTGGAATIVTPSAGTGATPSAATAAELESRITELENKLKEEHVSRMTGQNALQQRLNALQTNVREMKPIVVHLHRRILLDEAREKMYKQNTFTREYRPTSWNMRELLSNIQQNDPDARHLSESLLRMILDNNHPIRVRRPGNDVAHHASDAEKRFAVDSNGNVDLSRAMRTDLEHVYDYASNGTSA
ncbi:hypothetical protein JOM56_003140 [Amanita muscaria]